MTNLLRFAPVLLAFVLQAKPAVEPGFTSLFNGKDFTVPGPRSEERGVLQERPSQTTRLIDVELKERERISWLPPLGGRSFGETEEAFSGFCRLESVGPRAPDTARRDRCRGGSGTVRRVRDRTP
jgi:hypothetical protein